LIEWASYSGKYPKIQQIVKHKLEKLPNSRAKVEITLTATEFKKHEDEALEHMSVGVEIQGFRPGKAPKARLEEKIGKDRIFSHALEHAVPQTLSEVSTKEDLRAVAEPKVAIKKYPMTGAENEELVFEAEFDVLPKIKLPDLDKTKITLEKPAQVETKEIDEVVASAQQARATYDKVTRGVKKGDRVEIDFTGKLDGVPLDQLVSKNHPFIIGNDYFLPDFEKNIYEMKSGDEKDFEINIPKDTQDSMIAGKKVDFHVKVHFVENVTLPTVDDEFAKNHGDAVDLADMKKKIIEALEHRKADEASLKTQNKMLETLASKTTFEVPDSLVERELDRVLNSIREDVEMRGLTFGDYLNSLKKTEADLRKDMRTQATKSVKIALVINQVGFENDIKITNEEIDAEIEKYNKQGQDIKRTEESANYFANILIHRKTVRFLSDKLLK
jgi:trigger factor